MMQPFPAISLGKIVLLQRGVLVPILQHIIEMAKLIAVDNSGILELDLKQKTVAAGHFAHAAFKCATL